MANFVAIPRAEIESHLTARGFIRAANSGNEVVYEINHKVEPRLVIKVYTSIRENAGTVRDAGDDAIRVCLVWRDGPKSCGLSKCTRVNRVSSSASTLGRLASRILAVYKDATTIVDAPRCEHCGTPVWTDSGRCRDRSCGRQYTGQVRQPSVPRKLNAPQFNFTAQPVPRGPMPPTIDSEEERQARIDAEAAKNTPEDPVQLF
jgi:hypothetical protein